ILLTVHVENIGVLLVKLGNRADAVRAEELVFVEHLCEDPPEPFRVDQSHDPRSATPKCPGPVGCIVSLSSGIRRMRFMIHSSARGMRSRCHASITVVAHRGRSPTIERTLSRVAMPSGSRSKS